MFLFLLYLVPVLIAGIIILRKISSIERLELLVPAGSILGLIFFTFFLNFVAFIIKGRWGILTAYFLVICLGLVFTKFIKSKDKKVYFPQGKQLFFWLLTIIIWGGFIYWKVSHALIGSDTNLYYAIAHSFVNGNFPPRVPWQPDIPLSYHTGASELLGAFYFFSGLDFQFLHLFFSAIFIFCAAQEIFWIINRRDTVISFLLSNLAVAVAFISFGFIYITWPVFPVQLPVVANISQLVLWLRDLPAVNQAIEVYGAPINLDALIYFIFHAFGLAIFFSLLVLILHYKKEKPLLGWSVICISLAGLALVNESLFVAAFPAVFWGIFFIEFKEKTFKKNFKKLLLPAAVTLLIVLSQGGIISSSINSSLTIRQSVLIFPKKADIKEDFNNYHQGQQSSKLLPEKSDWLPLRWFHIGTDILFVLCLIAVLSVKKDFKFAILIKSLFIAGLTSLIAYNVIVPKFLVANGNRFLSASFLLLSLVLFLSLIPLYEKITKNVILRILFLIFIVWIFVPTILPPSALLSKTRFGENKLIPRVIQSSGGILWLKKNAGSHDRVMVLDKNAPHPSGQSRALVEAGVLAPLFAGDIRAFTIEASPEYMDIAYYLSPQALKKLKVNILLIDADFFETLPNIRRRQLENSQYFEKMFDYSNNQTDWERIYRIKNKYLDEGEEIDGTFMEFVSVIPVGGKIYIDNEENFHPSFLRRALIFSIRDKDIYFLPQSGVYLNVEIDINSHPPEKDGNYQYLILGPTTNPVGICNCETELIWRGVKNQVFIWRKI